MFRVDEKTKTRTRDAPPRNTFDALRPARQPFAL
jgi:hypothetical protein